MSRYRDAKITVEQCFQFDIQSLKHDLKRVDHENSISSMREWRDPLGRLEAVLGYWIGRMSGEGLIVLVDPRSPLPSVDGLREHVTLRWSQADFRCEREGYGFVTQNNQTCLSNGLCLVRIGGKLCRKLCRNPAIPTDIWPCRRASLGYR